MLGGLPHKRVDAPVRSFPQLWRATACFLAKSSNASWAIDAAAGRARSADPGIGFGRDAVAAPPTCQANVPNSAWRGSARTGRGAGCGVAASCHGGQLYPALHIGPAGAVFCSTCRPVFCTASNGSSATIRAACAAGTGPRPAGLRATGPGLCARSDASRCAWLSAAVSSSPGPSSNACRGFIVSAWSNLTPDQRGPRGHNPSSATRCSARHRGAACVVRDLQRTKNPR